MDEIESFIRWGSQFPEFPFHSMRGFLERYRREAVNTSWRNHPTNYGVRQSSQSVDNTPRGGAVYRFPSGSNEDGNTG